MCAIFGIIGTYEEEKAIEAFDTLAHRGIDAKYTSVNAHCFLGVHRLAITDVTKTLTPIYNHDGLQILFNGEIYNYEVLAVELQLHKASEIDVLYAAYRVWGDDFVKHLRGMFAIAIIEEAQVKLFRDPFGKKPIYYTLDEQRFIFASEMKAIHSLVPFTFDRQIVTQYLSFQTPLPPHTFHRYIHQVDAGEMVTFSVDERRVKRKRYYTPFSEGQTISEQKKAEEQLENVLLESVAMRLPKEVKFACLLSGGVDSSLICAMASLIQKVHTFSIGYEGYEKYDERPYAKTVSEHIKSNHHEVLFSKTDFLQTIEEVIGSLDEPLADPAMLPLYHLMKAVHKEGFKVVLTGDGSDELFMGYRTYKEFYALEQAKELGFKGWLQNYFKSHFSMHKEWEWYKRIFEGSTLFRSTAEIFTDLQQNRLLRMNVKDNRSLAALESYKEEFEQSGRVSPMEWYSFVDLKVMLGNVFLRKLDRMSMAHSIEARSPFLDKEVVATAFSCTPDLRMMKPSKALVKNVARKYLPNEIVDRKKKGFNYPYMEWLQESGELEVIHRIQEKMNLFNESELEMYLEKGKQGMFKQHLFSLYMLCKWLEKVNRSS
ncbi:asparagine synthase (glutamine-hydrolyzing) [Sulfurovum sp. XTW-4]|uniref:asparagine synthase (glutamine-hydrolyzing) n=1 Tax=Sulfurovum xiamenensis TaxID=3019066 RepID=A0ABT7QRM9_9BACT|nr:asparagine synthase (glutamine-hydrolyzing) [Sulfurovum xiamenensis]MDM5263696.1 asparagine synthase (glutamine-hydrolyzing) [Sulfurovum xiamenensis]